MSTATKNTPFTVRTTVAPAVCAHCHKPSSNPPAWMKLLDVMAGGRGKEEQSFSIGALAEKADLSRQRTTMLVDQAVKAGVLEVPAGISGARVYRRTWYGRQLLGRWKSLGWRA